MVILLFKMDALFSHVGDYELKIMCMAIPCNQTYQKASAICIGNKNDLHLFADYRRASKLCINIHCLVCRHIAFPLLKKTNQSVLFLDVTMFIVRITEAEKYSLCGQDAEFLYVAAGDTVRLTGFINLHLGYVNNEFLIINQPDALISQIYSWNETLHVSDSSSVHHQEFFTVHTACEQAVRKPV